MKKGFTLIELLAVILIYIVDYLPIKSINNEDSLIIANKTGLDTSILLNKYWNIV